ncbi:MAG: sodium:proton antiporter [Acidobacteria bacterium]|nr:MAG: sodium:proton antiporter [Acidobacteriota bacterium]
MPWRCDMSTHGIKHIVAVHSAKGGVGKSTVAVNLAIGLTQLGARVGLMDADIHGPSIAKMLGNTSWPQPGPYQDTIKPLEAYGLQFISMANLTTAETPIIWRGAMLNSVLSQFFSHVQWHELDYLIVDMPPGTGDVQLTLAQNIPLSGVVVVSTPQELALSDTIRGTQAFQRLEVPILGVVENMSYFICNECQQKTEIFGDSAVHMLAEELKTRILARIPIEPGITTSGDEGKPFILAHPESESSKALEKAAQKILNQLEDKVPTSVLNLEWVPMEAGERITVPPRMEVDSGLEMKALWQVSQTELGIVWENGDTSIIPVRKLRLACPCAVCVDEWTGEDLLDPKTVPEDLSVEHIQTVGRYAIQPVFSDGHDTGIFHFESLRSLASD